jgi:DNA-binding transcriptional regulator YiaG/REP element-mobilizing transposase RayT
MARSARNTLQSNLVLVTQNCNGVLYRDDEDREFFLALLKKVQMNFNCHILAFCCNESDRFQIILDTQGARISKIIQSLTIAYSIHRKSDIKLFTQRFKTKAIFSEAQLKEVIQEIQKDRKDYAACCMMSETMAKYEWMKPYNQALFIQIEQTKQTLTKEDLVQLLNSLLNELHIENSEFKRNKPLRNEWIKQLRQKYNCNLNSLADVLDLSESTISKIINTEQST